MPAKSRAQLERELRDLRESLWDLRDQLDDLLTGPSEEDNPGSHDARGRRVLIPSDH